ncbi:MAG: PAS domain S-box protein, partial [Candidatus Acidiferrum sp.]
MKVDRPAGPTTRTSAKAENLLSLQVAALEAAANPILISRANGIIVWVNKAFEQLSGYSRSEAIGQSTRLLKSGVHSASFYKNLWETILSGQKWQGELSNRRKNGTLYQEQMTITPVKNAAGQITHFIAIKLDVTERKRSDERIRLLAQAVENSSELIAITNSKGRILFVNKALLRATGYSEVELRGKHFESTLVSPNNPPHFSEDVLTRTHAGTGWRGECLSLRRDGTDFPTFLTTGRIDDDKGQLIGLYGISHDITERKQMEEELRKSEAYYRTILGSALDSITVADPHGRFEYVNQAACRLFGYTSSELLAMNISDILDVEELPRLKQLSEHLVPGEVSYQEWRSRRKNGAVFPAEVGVSLMPNGRVLGIGHDISDRKRVELELRASKERLDLAVEVADIGEWDLDLVSHTASRSPRHDQIFGYDSLLPEWTYEIFLSHVLPQDRAQVDEKFKASRISGFWNFETRIRRVDGKVRWIWARGRRWMDEQGQATRMIGTVIDITERKEAEEAQRQVVERLRLAQLAAGMGIFDIDLESSNASWSAQMLE